MQGRWRWFSEKLGVRISSKNELLTMVAEGVKNCTIVGNQKYTKVMTYVKNAKPEAIQKQ